MKIEQSIRQAYGQISEIYELVRPEVLDYLEETCRNNKWLLTERIKPEESYALKIMTGRTDGYEIDDFFACTIVVPNLLALDSAKKLISECFDIIEEKPGKFIKSRPTEFNFDGLRFYCTLKKSVTSKIYDGKIFEIQIKTFLEHAWSEATHDFSYKSKDISWAKERLSAQIKAILDNADLSIFEMEKLSSSPFLNKRNPKYERESKVMTFIEGTFGNDSNTPLPEDRKRLAQEVNRLLKSANVTLNDLSKILKKETKEGRGTKTKNLSIYSIILFSIFNQAPVETVKNLRKNMSKSSPTIIIPKELEIKEIENIDRVKGLNFLEEYDPSKSPETS